MLKKKPFSRVFVENGAPMKGSFPLSKFIFGHLYGNSYGNIKLLEQSRMLSFYVLEYVRFWTLSFARLTKG
jgi:hypothetical protein